MLPKPNLSKHLLLFTLLIGSSFSLKSQIISLEPLQLYLANYPDVLNGYSPPEPVVEYTPSLRFHNPLSKHWSWLIHTGLSGINHLMVKEDFSSANAKNPISIYYSRLAMLTYAGAEFWTARPEDKRIIYRHSVSAGLDVPLVHTPRKLINGVHPGLHTRSTISLVLTPNSMISFIANYGVKYITDYGVEVNKKAVHRWGAGLTFEYALN